MGELLYNDFADLGALSKQKEEIKKYFTEIKDSIIELNNMGFKLDSAKGMKDIEDANKTILSLQEKLAAANKKVTESEKQMADTRQKLANASKQAADYNTAVKTSYNSLSDSLDENVKRQQKLKQEISEVNSALKKANEFASAAGNLPQFADQVGDLAKKQSILKVELEQVNRLIKNQTKEIVAEEGSLDELRARLNQMLQAYDSLSEARKNTADGRDYLKQIKDLTNEISKQEQAQGRFFRNVGNYPASAKIIVDAFEEARKKVVAMGEDLGKAGPKGEATRKEFEALQRIVDDKRFLNVSAKVGDYRREISYFTRALAQLEDQGLRDTQVYRSLQKELARLTDLMADTRQEVQALSSDTRRFDLWASAVGTLASSFQVAASAAEIFGGENEEVEKSVRKLMAIQNISNGVRAIANDLTQKGTAANKAYVVVQNLVSTAMDKTAAASARLTAALGLIGIALAVVGGAVAVYQAFKKETEAVNEVNSKAVEIYAEQVYKLEKLTEKIKKGNLSKVDQKKAIKDVNEEFGKYGVHLKSVNDLEEFSIKQAPALIKMMKLKAQATAAQDLAIEEYKKQLKAQVEGQDETLNFWQKSAQLINGVSAAFSTGSIKMGLQAGKATGDQFYYGFLSKSKEKQTAYEQIGDDLEEMAKKIAKEFNLNYNGDAEGDSGNRQSQLTKRLAEERKAADDLIKLRKRFAIEEAKAIADSEQLTAEVRVAARRDQLKLEKELIEMEKGEAIRSAKAKAQAEIHEKGVTSEEIKAITGRLASELLQIEDDYAKKSSDIEIERGANILKIRKDSAEKMKSDAEAYQQQLGKGIVDKQVEQAQKAFESRTELSLMNSKKELETQIEYLRTGQIKKEEFEKNKLDIEERYAKSSLQSQIEYYRQLVLIADLPVEKRKEALDKLAELEKQVNETSLKDAEDFAKKQADMIERLRQSYKDLQQTIAEAFSGIVEGAFDAQRERIQEQIDLVDRRRQAEIDAINSTSMAEEEKAKRIKLIDAKAAGDKAALEKRQRDIERNKAVFDRDLKAFEISAEGIRAVMQLKAEVSLLKAKALVNPAYGGLAAIAAAQIPIQITTTAASLASLLALPLPKYASGVESSPETWALVGEAGRELGVDKSGNVTMYDRPTLAYLTQGTTILPNKVTEDIVNGSGLLSQVLNGKSGGSLREDKSERLLNDAVGELREIKKKPTSFVIHNTPSIETSAYYLNNLKW